MSGDPNRWPAVVSTYVHSSKDSMGELAEQIGVDRLEFRHALCELKVVMLVNEDSSHTIERIEYGDQKLVSASRFAKGVLEEIEARDESSREDARWTLDMVKQLLRGMVKE